MTFFTAYFVPLFMVLIMGTMTAWFEKPKGEREITLKDAMIIAGISVVPIVNLVLAVALLVMAIVDAVIWCIGAAGLASLFHDSDRRVLFSDRNKK